MFLFIQGIVSYVQDCNVELDFGDNEPIMIPYQSDDVYIKHNYPQLHFRCHLQWNYFLVKLLWKCKDFSDQEISLIIKAAAESTAELDFNCSANTIYDSIRILLSSGNDKLIGWGIDVFEAMKKVGTLSIFEAIHSKYFIITVICDVVFGKDEEEHEDFLCSTAVERLINFYRSTKEFKPAFVNELTDALYLAENMPKCNDRCNDLAEFLKTLDI